MTFDKIIVGAVGGAFAITLTVISYFVVKTYDRVDSMYEFSIKHPEQHARLIETIKRDNSDLWIELNKINRYLADRDTHFYYIPKHLK